MKTNYTNERNTQILLSLLKAHGIKKFVVSPGTTNIRLVASMQQDSWFELYSSVDERSAAYMACGMAAETRECVGLSCTGATASRNYVSGLTEAYYRKLPVLAVTSTQHRGRIEQNIAQTLDRSIQMKDTVKLSIPLPTVHSEEDAWSCMVQANRAILELKRAGGGPVHIDLETEYSSDFSVKELPSVNVIHRYTLSDDKPAIPYGRVCIFVGAHNAWSDDEIEAIDNFCEVYNAVVLCDHTSNYKGKYRVLFSMVTSQEQYIAACKAIDTLIHIGNVSGAYPGFHVKNVWRVNPDGEIRDTFKRLRNVFEMEEKDFFTYYANLAEKKVNTQLDEWSNERQHLFSMIPELPFSNLWIASQTAGRLPENSVLHLAILNSLRSWNFFEIPESVLSFTNTGGFGIDGGMSAMIGASLVNPNKIFYFVTGDLAFFYDMNVLGNRHIGKNVRILLVNNGVGTEFKNYNHQAARFGTDANEFIAAAGHFGKQSHDLVKHYSTDLGFKYLSANNKDEYLKCMNIFLDTKVGDKPILLEAFTNYDDESQALKMMNSLDVSATGLAKQIVKSIAGEKAVQKIKKVLGK